MLAVQGKWGREQRALLYLVGQSFATLQMSINYLRCRAVINRYGFNSDGIDAVSQRLGAYHMAR